MNSFENTELIEAYLNGKLTEADKKSFENRLKTDVNWRKDVLTHKLVADVFKRYPMLQAQEIVERLGADLFAAAADAEPVNIITTKDAYTLDELFDMFRPIEHLEMEMSRRSTAADDNNLQNSVLFPLSGIACMGKELSFELDRPLEIELEVAVFDNKETEVAVTPGLIEPETINFTLYFPEIMPGRYYWQITPLDVEAQARYGSATGSFFIRKDLMPEE